MTDEFSRIVDKAPTVAREKTLRWDRKQVTERIDAVSSGHRFSLGAGWPRWYTEANIARWVSDSAGSLK